MHLRSFDLAEKSILVGDACALGIHHVHAYHHVLRCGPRGRQEEYRYKQNRD
jgi:hypothetical protein